MNDGFGWLVFALIVIWIATAAALATTRPDREEAALARLAPHNVRQAASQMLAVLSLGLVAAIVIFVGGLS